ncbi:histidine--tRNA ligase [Flavobacteriaceae bacterium S356]|uniref:Histidine--tRNA ligase n=1 Tax=Asprobacillus argus TaxID=3076534 RepID=A0ABU3LFW6_9FLAO|nr:histidine--tRNA ligase [Flavobacteriaceae bacterium S356]
MKPSIPKGTRDFSSTEVANRTYIMNTIKEAFETFGFQPIETPSFENSATLMGKYGEEGDRLIFKILDSGDYLSSVRNNIFNTSNVNVAFFDLIDTLFDANRNSGDFEETLQRLLEIYSRRLITQDEREYLSEFLLNSRTTLEDKFNSINDRNDSLYVQLRRGFFSEFFDNYVKDFEVLKSSKVSSLISNKALRYDLTVPFARYVVQHQNDITFPFKRYQIQPVWRADRPQKGRFREFYQCDADVVGSQSLLQEVDFVQLYDTVFTKLKLVGTTIKMNNRKILSGIAEVIGAKDKLIDFTVALDKLDKIGKEGVVTEMLSKGISQEAIDKVAPLFNFSGTNQQNLDALETMLASSEEGLQGVEELRFVIDTVDILGLQSASLELDVTLARGLNYYTGAIFEVTAPEGVQMGSIGGGGRYDDLTGIFGLKDVSGVGISFGLDRIYLVLEELGLFDSVQLPKPDVLFLNFEESERIQKLQAIQTLRSEGIKSEIYPDIAASNKQQKKQWKYATTRAIPFVISGIENDKFVVKDLVAGEQYNLSLAELIVKTKL